MIAEFQWKSEFVSDKTTEIEMNTSGSCRKNWEETVMRLVPHECSMIMWAFMFPLLVAEFYDFPYRIVDDMDMSPAELQVLLNRIEKQKDTIKSIR